MASAGRHFANSLAAALEGADWTSESLSAVAAALGKEGDARWVKSLVQELLARRVTPYGPPPRTVAGWILNASALADCRERKRAWPVVPIALEGPIRHSPMPVFQDLALPDLPNEAALALWLGLEIEELQWFSDIGGYRALSTNARRRHYRFTWIPKRTGSPRLIEAPKARLKAIQRKILKEMLDPLPQRACVHGYRKGHSCLSAAQLHAGEAVVLSLDLANFFPSVPIHRVHGIFRCLGYPWRVARHLTGLCSTRLPVEAFDALPEELELDWRTQNLYHQRHLPQGAPTSPALANLACYRLDGRLTALAKRLEANYSRYGDDLAFSGDRDFADRAPTFIKAVSRIAEDSGFALNLRKQRIMRQGSRQQLLGQVVNQHINVPRESHDRLKAILFNCVGQRPASQNRKGIADFRAHLEGRISWVERCNPHRGLRLRLLFEQISWE